MRNLVVAGAVMLSCLSTSATACGSGARCLSIPATECNGGDKLLSVENWSVEAVEENIIPRVTTTIRVKSEMKKPFRMVDASYEFVHSGRLLSRFKFDPDLKVRPGEVVEIVSRHIGYEMNPVLGVEREAVSLTTCVRSVVYDDGAKEEFQ